MKLVRSLPGLCAALLAAPACKESSPPPSAPKTVTERGQIGTLEPEQQPLAERAVALLAEELKIPKEDIEVDSVRAVEWRDSSLGCPEPGQAYLQVMTPGHKITLRAGKRLYFVHEAKGRAFLCRQKKVTPTITEKMELVWGQQALEARKDLAQRLGVSAGEIRIASARARTWPDRSLGCPEKGVEYPEEPVKGFVLTLAHGQRRYTYHTDLSRVIPCPAITTE